jgi:hypothetical protein
VTQSRVFSTLESRDLVVSSPNLIRRDPDPSKGSGTLALGAPGHARRSGLYVQGSDTLPWKSIPTDDVLEYITSSGHVASLGQPRGGAGCCRGSRVAARAWGELRLGPTYGTPTTRLGGSGVGSLSLYGSRRYPSFRVPIVAPGPT